MDPNLLTNFLPAAIVAAIIGLTYLARDQFGEKDDKGEVTKAPKWLLAVPCLLGLVTGSLHYFTSTANEVIAATPWWDNMLSAIEASFGYAGAAVLVWELYVHTIGKPAEPPK